MNQFVGEQTSFRSLISLFMSAGEYSHFTTLERCSSTTGNFMNMISFPRTSILNKRRKPSVISNEMVLMCKWPCHTIAGFIVMFNDNHAWGNSAFCGF